jgi:hypothetical protein
VARLAAYRGVGQLGALALAAEVGDWRRFAHAGGFMAFTGLVPCERSSGDSVWRGHITRTGSKHLRFQLVESAWSYHHRPLIAGPSASVNNTSVPTPWPAPGRRSCGCAAASGSWSGASTSPVWPWSPSLGSLLGSCGPRWWPEPMLLTVGGSPIGVTAPASPRARRSTAVAGKIPATLLPRRRRRDASSLGLRPAHSRLAVPTREHQRGGPPIHAAPTRPWPTSARPPPTGHLDPIHHAGARSCSPRLRT